MVKFPLVLVVFLGIISIITATDTAEEELRREVLEQLLRAALEKDSERAKVGTAEQLKNDNERREWREGRDHSRIFEWLNNYFGDSDVVTEAPPDDRPDCKADDFARCQLEAIQASLDSAKQTDIPIFIRCEMLKGLSDCDQNVLDNCKETDDLIISDNVKEVHGRIDKLEGNCSCKTSAQKYERCADQCSAQPCINGGQCISDDSGTFEECICPEPYKGEFCQYCEDCDLCDQFDKCECKDGMGGPFCNMNCCDLDTVKLYRACVQIANDFYFRYYPYPSLCVFALILDECVAASANSCGRDMRTTLEDLDLLAGYDQAKFNLDYGICKVGGSVPFTI